MGFVCMCTPLVISTLSCSDCIPCDLIFDHLQDTNKTHTGSTVSSSAGRISGYAVINGLNMEPSQSVLWAVPTIL